jgi:hypothetical protein
LVGFQLTIDTYEWLLGAVGAVPKVLLVVELRRVGIDGPNNFVLAAATRDSRLGEGHLRVSTGDIAAEAVHVV